MSQKAVSSPSQAAAGAGELQKAADPSIADPHSPAVRRTATDGGPINRTDALIIRLSSKMADWSIVSVSN
jgi:hypothetical protein